MFDRFDAYHLFVNLAQAYTPVGLVMIVMYGAGDVISHFQNVGCEMHFYQNDGVDRENIQAIFFAAIGSWAIATKIFGLQFHESITDMFNPKAFFYVAAVVLGITSVVMTQFGVLTGSCRSLASDNDVVARINGEVKTMLLYGGVVFSLLLSFAINNLDIVSYRSFTDSKTVIFLYTNAWSMVALTTRLLLSSFLVVMLQDDGKNSFYLNHGNTLLESTTCLASLAVIDTNTAEYKLFESIDLAKITYPSGNIKVVPHESMVNLLWSVVAIAGVEAVLRLAETIPNYAPKGTYPEVLAEYQIHFSCCARFLGFYSDVILSLFVFVLIMSNEIASCPLLDPTDGTVEVVYWLSILFLIQGVVSGAWKDYTFHGKFDEAAAKKAGWTWGQAGYSKVDSFSFPTPSAPPSRGPSAAAATKF